MLLVKFLEMEYPVADRVVPQIRKVQTFLEKVSGNNEVCQTVRNFVCYLLANFAKERRFREFAPVFLAVTLLNPDKDSRSVLTINESLDPKRFILALETSIPLVLADSPPVSRNAPSSEDSQKGVDDPIEAMFDEIHFEHNKRVRLEKNNDGSLEHELLTFIDTVNEDRPAFQFSRAEKTKWPKLSHAARIILCTLPSPACAERAFSRAALLTDSRRTRLKMDNLKTRLII